MNEEWRSVTDFPDYEVSNLGRVRRITGGKGVRAGRILRPTPHTHGYKMVSLFRNGATKKLTIHRVVAGAFIGPRPPGAEINHKNGVKADNCAENLEYVSPHDNHVHAAATGLGYVGTKNGQAKLAEEQVNAIREACASGLSQRAAAAAFGVSQTHVSRIVTGKRRLHG